MLRQVDARSHSPSLQPPSGEEGAPGLLDPSPPIFDRHAHLHQVAQELSLFSFLDWIPGSECHVLPFLPPEAGMLAPSPPCFLAKEARGAESLEREVPPRTPAEEQGGNTEGAGGLSGLTLATSQL
jgi:hypothetical protein